MTVAVKVSTATLDGVSRQRFHTEADRMAQLSSHPYILSVYDVGVTYEGQDYIVFGIRPPAARTRRVMRARSMNADQVLDLGIKLASALYTRASRGYRPPRYQTEQRAWSPATGQPVLADFGVSATIYQSGVTTGHSPAWAAPEVIIRRHRRHRGFGLSIRWEPHCSRCWPAPRRSNTDIGFRRAAS